MRRDLGVFILAVCAGFAQPPDKFVTIDIAAVDAHGQAVSRPAEQRNKTLRQQEGANGCLLALQSAAPRNPACNRHGSALEKARIRSAVWLEAVDAMRRFAEHFIASRYQQGVLAGSRASGARCNFRAGERALDGQEPAAI